MGGMYERVESAHVWRGTLVTGLLNATLAPVELVIGRGVAGLPWWPSILSSAVGLATVLVLWLRRRHASKRVGSVLFLVNTAAITVPLWVTTGYYAPGVANWAPFQAHKLGALAVGLLAPEAWVGALGVAAFTGTALVRIATFEPAVQAHLPQGEPWVLLVFGLFGLVLLGYRLRGQVLERKAMQAQA